ncbi:hypothetical protein G7Z17_g1836 [Cylindrodendrum hubeiense]|uniref:Cobalamin-independent methionine synthase MetE C-terminal/archaeal domain-containing protein n=1 Tax=Cylindrodendrum hubeiense TaxID=595255 RepID=A0A9P5HKY2_9HYPO|nr:hypothetical protein G7Z17_g1836 [Cylindrodendrum hubeiense]
MAPPFRADQVGSLIRPLSVLEANKTSSFYKEETSQSTAIQEAIQAIVKKQLDLGIRPITSGEFERLIFYSGLFEKLSGVVVEQLPIPDSLRPGLPLIPIFQSFGMKAHAVVVAKGRAEHKEAAYLSGWNMLRGCLPADKWKECKIALPSPTWQHLQVAKGLAFDSSVYASDREYFLDLARAYQQELKILYDAGLRVAQVDDPNMLFFLSEGFKDGCRTEGVDPDELIDLYIWAHNECLKNRPANFKIGVHFCRGNFPGSTSVIDGLYEGIAKKLFNELDYDCFYLEFDDSRSGSFESLRHLPKGKSIVLGLVSTKTPELENVDDLKIRVQSAAEAISEGQGASVEDAIRDSLAVSPQCGFASAAGGKGIGMTEEKQWEKLTLVRDLARQMWPDAI